MGRNFDFLWLFTGPGPNDGKVAIFFKKFNGGKLDYVWESFIVRGLAFRLRLLQLHLESIFFLHRRFGGCCLAVITSQHRRTLSQIQTRSGCLVFTLTLFCRRKGHRQACSALQCRLLGGSAPQQQRV
jgi:hypothetical protein